MLLHTHPLFSVYFGDAQDSVYPDQFRAFAAKNNLLDHESCTQLKKVMRLDGLTFLHQTHSDQGILITDEQDKTPFSQSPFCNFLFDGDYLITNKEIALGVLTADCLPIVMYDKVHHVLALVHAGWRGSVQEIAVKAVAHMEQAFGTNPAHLCILFGPCAKTCCYTVTEEFRDHIATFPWADRTMQKIGSDYHFDLPLFNTLLLEKDGIKSDAISLSYNVCTICNDNFFSHRRQGAHAGRQMTVAWLK
ncbi:MAG: peptidoglycan editing factor PgeF [Candidatus Babeliales bacterium]